MKSKKVQKTMLVAFIEGVLGLRGTHGNTWALAHFNETMLGNKSIIIARSLATYRDSDTTDESVFSFTDRFETHFLPEPSEYDAFLKDRGVHVAYIVLAGFYNETETQTPTSVPTIVHCVFANMGTKGTLRVAVSPIIRAVAPVLSNIVYVDATKRTDLRAELGIAPEAIVIGRYGGYNQFDVPFVVNHIVAYARAHPHVVFLFMNTRPFTSEEVPNIKFLPGKRQLDFKMRFIRTCDAMLHARSDGETHGMSVGEFALMGRPVITTRCGNVAHIDVYLRERAIVVSDVESLERALDHVKRIDNNDIIPPTGYDECTPAIIMPQFASFLDRAITEHASKIV